MESVCCLFTTFFRPHDDIKAVVIQLVWLSLGTFDLLRSVILVGNTELCVFTVRADQQEIVPAFELPLFHRGDSVQLPGRTCGNWSERVGTGRVHRIRVRGPQGLSLYCGH